jgi:hypothetical protein
MQNPPGYDSEEGSVKYLKKSLYGLKQAGRKWYNTLKCSLGDLGFCVSDADPGVFHTRIGEHPIVIAVHVDDCAITSSLGELMQDYKCKINTCVTIQRIVSLDLSLFVHEVFSCLT